MSKNAFYFFMQDFRRDESAKGISYSNLSEVAHAASPLWKDASPDVRSKYQEMAKNEKQKKNSPDSKLTSSGISLAELERQKRNQIEEERAELQDIQSTIKQKISNGEITAENLFLIDVNCFCKLITEDYIIGEVTLLQFNLKDGIKNYYHELINPGKIPVGYTSDVKRGCKEIGLEMPDENLPTSDYTRILANIIKFLKQNDRNTKAIPPLYTLPNKVLPVKNFILQMCSSAGEVDDIFRVYRLDTLLFNLTNAVKTAKDDGYAKQHVALAQLERELLMFVPGLACDVHDAADRTLVCTESRAKRWAYTVLDCCCPLLAIEMLPGTHAPSEDDNVPPIPTYPLCSPGQDASGRGPAPYKAQYVARSNSSYESSRSPNESTCGSSINSKATVPPQFAQNRFSNEFIAALSRGRGRVLAASLAKMDINK